MSFSRASDYEPQTQDKVIGLFVVLALAALIYLLMHRVFIEHLMGDWIHLKAEMSKTYGVTKGTLIELSGVTIGEVESVNLQPNTRVVVEMRFDQSHAYLLREDCQFRINSQLGIDTVLSGVRLELVPGEKEALISENSMVNIIEPKSLDQLVDEFKLEQLAEQAQSIVANLEKITGVVADRQDKISATLEHLEKLSLNLSNASTELPGLLAEVSKTNQVLQQNLVNVDHTLSEFRAPVVSLMKTANSTLLGVEQTLAVLNPTFKQMPILLDSTDQTLQSINYLSYKLSNHWLLNGSGESEVGSSSLRMMPDDSLYHAESKETVNNIGTANNLGTANNMGGSQQVIHFEP